MATKNLQTTSGIGNSKPPRGPILLSTGRTILHRREPNGSQFAYPAESETLEMTHAEWDEYCAKIMAKVQQ